MDIDKIVLVNVEANLVNWKVIYVCIHVHFHIILKAVTIDYTSR